MICGIFECTRQGYHKYLGRCIRKQEHEDRVIAQVLKYRRSQPKAGVRKLKKMLSDDPSLSLRIGRDRLFALLRERNMLVRNRRKYKACTDYRHKYRIYPNLLPELEVSRINQVWVSDITYIRTYPGFVYLYLVTDYFSRKIVGYHISGNLKTESAVKALRKAIGTKPAAEGLIHHSDHGVQYCSDEYQSLLKHNEIRPSMTGRNRCYDNAVAERINGILKDEFGLNRMLPDITVAREVAGDAVRIYNRERLHQSLNYQTPEAVYNSCLAAEATRQQSVLRVGASAL